MDLSQLAALEEIRLVKARYCRFIDTQQWEAFALLFARDASLTFYDVGGDALHRFTNLQQFLTSTIETLSGAHSIHQVHNPEIEINPPGFASAIWSMEDRIQYADGAQRSLLLRDAAVKARQVVDQDSGIEADASSHSLVVARSLFL